MKVKIEDRKLKTEKTEEKFTGLESLDSNFIIDKLESNIELRETPVDKQLKKRLLK